MTTLGRPTLRTLAAPGVAAVRHHWRPFVAIQAVALLLVLLYFRVPAVTSFCARLAHLRVQGGYAAAMLATAFAGAILPELAKAVTQRGWRPDRRTLADLAFLLPVFALNGLLVDAFYRLLARLFGGGNDWSTVLLKAATDQLLFTPFIALPLVATLFTLRRLHFDAAATGRELNRVWYGRRVVPLLLPCWAFWGPMVLLIYSLPTALQFVLFALAMAAWSLLLVFIGGDETPPTTASPGLAGTRGEG